MSDSAKKFWIISSVWFAGIIVLMAIGFVMLESKIVIGLLLIGIAMGMVMCVLFLSVRSL